MPDQRPAIPADLTRRVLVEAGHRCAVPTCRQTPVELAHIVPWAQVKTHEFENLIALCPTCHTRYDNEEIDRKSMRIYKTRLAAGINVHQELHQRVARLEQEAKEQHGKPPQGFAAAVALYYNRTCLIGIIDGPGFVTVGSCTFIRPRVAIVPGAVLEMIDEVLRLRGDYAAVWEPGGMSKFREIRTPKEDGDLRLIELAPAPVAEPLEKDYCEQAAPFIKAAFSANESPIRADLGIYKGEHVGLLLVAENTDGIRGAMEFQFQDAYVSFRGNSIRTGIHSGYLTPIPCALNYAGAPVFRPDGTLIALVTDMIFVEAEQGGRPFITTLLSLPELWKSNLERQL